MEPLHTFKTQKFGWYFSFDVPFVGEHLLSQDHLNAGMFAIINHLTEMYPDSEDVKQWITHAQITIGARGSTVEPIHFVARKLTTH